VSGEWWAPPHGKSTPGTHHTGGWVGPRTQRYYVEEKNFLPFSGIEPRPSSRSPSLYRLSYPDSHPFSPFRKCNKYSGRIRRKNTVFTVFNWSHRSLQNPSCMLWHCSWLQSDTRKFLKNSCHFDLLWNHHFVTSMAGTPPGSHYSQVKCRSWYWRPCSFLWFHLTYWHPWWLYDARPI
jgi:hypothetical protein